MTTSHQARAPGWQKNAPQAEGWEYAVNDVRGPVPLAVRHDGCLSHDCPRDISRPGDFLAICYAAYYRTGNPLYLQMFRFWRKIFAIGFALGIVLTFELGLNWGNYARAVGPVLTSRSASNEVTG